jgi:hypothetical protein
MAADKHLVKPYFLRLGDLDRELMRRLQRLYGLERGPMVVRLIRERIDQLRKEQPGNPDWIIPGTGLEKQMKEQQKQQKEEQRQRELERKKKKSSPNGAS